MKLVKVAGLLAAIVVAPSVAQAVTLQTVVTHPGSYAYVDVADSGIVQTNSGFSWDPSDAQVRSGNGSGFRSPFDETSDLGTCSSTVADGCTTNYFAVGPSNLPNPVKLNFEDVQNYFSMLWGSPDTYNELTFYLGDNDVGSFTSTADVPRATAGGASAGSVFVAFTGEYDAVHFDSGNSNAFEFSNVSTVPLPASAFLLMAGLGGLAAMRRRKKVA